MIVIIAEIKKSSGRARAARRSGLLTADLQSEDGERGCEEDEPPRDSPRNLPSALTFVLAHESELDDARGLVDEAERERGECGAALVSALDVEVRESCDDDGRARRTRRAHGDEGIGTLREDEDPEVDARIRDLRKDDLIADLRDAARVRRFVDEELVGRGHGPLRFPLRVHRSHDRLEHGYVGRHEAPLDERPHPRPPVAVQPEDRQERGDRIGRERDLDAADIAQIMGDARRAVAIIVKGKRVNFRPHQGTFLSVSFQGTSARNCPIFTPRPYSCQGFLTAPPSSSYTLCTI